MTRTALYRLLAAWMAMMLAFSCGGNSRAEEEKPGYVPEENTEYRPKVYPYLIKTGTSRIYFRQQCPGSPEESDAIQAMLAMLDDMEADFEHVKLVLEPYLKEDISPVRILVETGQDPGKNYESVSIVYDPRSRMIRLYGEPENARPDLLVGYIGYLLTGCMEPPCEVSFWLYGISGYLSCFSGADRLLRSAADTSLYTKDRAYLIAEGAWDTENACPDPERYCLLLARNYSRGYYVGQKYAAVGGRILTRTEEIQQNMRPDFMSEWEAASMTAFLVERYGEEKVMRNFNCSMGKLEQVYGKGFEQLYAEWILWNEARCAMFRADTARMLP